MINAIENKWGWSIAQRSLLGKNNITWVFDESGMYKMTRFRTFPVSLTILLGTRKFLFTLRWENGKFWKLFKFREARSAMKILGISNRPKNFFPNYLGFVKFISKIWKLLFFFKNFLIWNKKKNGRRSNCWGFDSGGLDFAYFYY